MSIQYDLRTIQKDQNPKLAIAVLAIIAVLSIYIVGYDQGQLFSLVQGNEAYDSMWLHEFTHDIRHAAGFPCH
ncbi:MAG: CbtB-domain containing protein [Thermoproteota archaeon]|nr:CbtB-domain containing protein [Thermoproteota archaeon]